MGDAQRLGESRYALVEQGKPWPQACCPSTQASHVLPTPDGDEEVRSAQFAGVGVDEWAASGHADSSAGLVDQQLLGRVMQLTHRAPQRAGVVLMVLAELGLRVGRAIGISLTVFLPQKMPSDTLAA